MFSRIFSNATHPTRFTQHFRNAHSQECGKKKLMDLSCKVALITGGERGIGAGAACHLLSRGLKAVVIAGVNEAEGQKTVEKLNAAYGKGRCCFVKLDVRIHLMFEDVMKKTLENYGSIDVLFNNAGILNDQQWKKTVDINLIGAIRGTLLGFEYMPKSETKSHGIIINCASILGYDTFPPASVYTSTKHGIRGFTKSIGHSCNPATSKTRVAALCPGVTVTEMTENVMPQLTDEMTAKTISGLKSLPGQTDNATNKAIAHIAEYAETGSLWPIEGNVLYKINEPDRKTFQNKIMDV